MSDVPTILEAKINSKIICTETLTLNSNPQPREIIEIMAKVARFLQRTAVEILSEKDGKMAMVSAANPAPNALLQCAATLENGAMQFDALVKQQGNLIGPGQARGPQRTPFQN